MNKTATEAFEEYLDQVCDWDMLGNPITNRDVDEKHRGYLFVGFNIAWNKLQAEVEAKQAEIDRLMLEFCPDEMTDEQKTAWENRQKSAKIGQDLSEALNRFIANQVPLDPEFAKVLHENRYDLYEQ